ncbi:PAS domain S-box protein [Candidatus Sumerlaeota bacterium]|nr:PAS domain S-box protein [Candidatus Sumerlaeota bacterium]
MPAKPSRDAERLRAMISAMPDLLIRQTRDGTCIDAEGGSDNILDIPPDQIVGRNIRVIGLPTDLVDRTIADIAQAIDSGNTQTSEHQIALPRGLRDLEIRIVPCGAGEALSIVRDITDRRQSEEAPRGRDHLYRQAIAASDAMPYQRDFRTGRFTFIGEEIERLTGYRPEEFADALEPWHTMVQETVFRGELAGLTREEARRRMHAGEVGVWRADHRILTRGGEERWLADTSVQIRDGSGEVVGSLGILQDITHRVRAEEALRGSEQFLKGVFDAIQDGISVLDTDLNILRVNAWMEKMYSDKAPLEGKKCYAVYQGRESPCPWCPTLDTIETGEAHSTIVPYPSAENPRGWIDLSVFPVNGSGGRVTSVIECVKDITAQRRAEEALRQSEATLQSIFRVAPAGIGLVCNRVLKHINDRICEMVGRSPEELLEHSARVLYPSEEEFEWVGREKYRQISEWGTGTVETQWLRENGEIIDVLLSSTPLDATDLSKGVTFTALDITERRRAAEELAQHRERLEELVRERTAELEATNRELESFSYSVSHDLRAPLRSIDGFSQVLLEDHAEELSADARDSLSRVRAASQRMGMLIDDLLKLSRVTRFEMHRQEVDISALASAIAAELRQSEPDRQGEFVIAGGITAHGDPVLLRLALENLLGNAWKFTAKCPRAHIELGELDTAEEERHFFVRDNGAGFDMAYVDKLFGAFQRLHRSEDFPGTGIGLATVQRIIHRHGGRVWAESAVDEGATFHFTL